MKILVAIKRVQDYNVKVRPKSDGSDVDIDGIKMGINPFDENALEEALRLREQELGNRNYGRFNWRFKKRGCLKTWSCNGREPSYINRK